MISQYEGAHGHHHRGYRPPPLQGLSLSDFFLLIVNYILFPSSIHCIYITMRVLLTKAFPPCHTDDQEGLREGAEPVRHISVPAVAIHLGFVVFSWKVNKNPGYFSMLRKGIESVMSPYYDEIDIPAAAAEEVATCPPRAFPCPRQSDLPSPLPPAAAKWRPRCSPCRPMAFLPGETR